MGICSLHVLLSKELNKFGLRSHVSVASKGLRVCVRFIVLTLQLLICSQINSSYPTHFEKPHIHAHVCVCGPRLAIMGRTS